MDSADDFIEQLAATVNSAPDTCTSEECIIQWVMHETQVIQSIYDAAVMAGFGSDDEVEELYKHKLQEVQDVSLAALGAREV